MKLRTFKRFLLAGSVSCLFFSSPAYATLKEALEALDDQDYSFAMEELKRLADKEQNAEARYHLGRMYENGLGVEKNAVVAMETFLQAAEQGNGKAALKIGDIYYTGKQGEKDYQKALKWYTLAAEKGSYTAQYNVALMYEEGTGVKKDDVKAFQFYKKSADQGYAPAQIALGHMFLKGIGTPQDYSQAIFWYKLAADQGDQEAQMKLAKLYSNKSVRGLPFNIVGAHMYFNLISAYGTSPLREEAASLRDQLTKKMQNEDVILAQKKANKWRKKKREESFPSMGGDDLLGNGDISSARQKKSPEDRQDEEKETPITVKTDLQELIVSAGVSRRDLNKAVRSDDFSAVESELKKKIEAGDVTAEIALADLYVLGQGLKENPKEAVKIYQKLAQDDNPVAFFRLAPMYCEGKGVEPDLAECYKFMLLAKNYADDDSAPFVAEAMQMLDENLDAEIREAGKKLAEKREAEKREGIEKGKKKKSGLSFFGGKDKKDEKKKIKKKETNDDPTDDLFSGL